jgi:uncharacterized OB-fold protein
MVKQNFDDIVTIPGEWHVRYDYAAGNIVSHFLKVIRDERKIVATKCPSCSLVMLPPRGYCERCFVEANEWMDVGNEGVIEASTIVTQQFDGLPKPPYAIAYARLDGASTAMVNYVEGLDLSDIHKAVEQLKIGKRVRVVFKENRKGRITDFYYEALK